MKRLERSSSKSSEKELQSFEELFRLYYPRLKKYAENFLRNTGEAEDLVQDVFFWYWQNKSRLSDEKWSSSYLFAAVKNRCLNVLKRKLVEEKYIVTGSQNASDKLYHLSFMEPGEFLSMEDRLLAEIDKIILTMPRKCQVVFRLKWKEGKKIKEIAEIMGISTTMVDKHISRGLEIARKNISPDRSSPFYSLLVLMTFL